MNKILIIILTTCVLQASELIDNVVKAVIPNDYQAIYWDHLVHNGIRIFRGLSTVKENDDLVKYYKDNSHGDLYGCTALDNAIPRLQKSNGIKLTIIDMFSIIDTKNDEEEIYKDAMVVLELSGSPYVGLGMVERYKKTDDYIYKSCIQSMLNIRSDVVFRKLFRNKHEREVFTDPELAKYYYLLSEIRESDLDDIIPDSAAMEYIKQNKNNDKLQSSLTLPKSISMASLPKNEDGDAIIPELEKKIEIKMSNPVVFGGGKYVMVYIHRNFGVLFDRAGIMIFSIEENGSLKNIGQISGWMS